MKINYKKHEHLLLIICGLIIGVFLSGTYHSRSYRLKDTNTVVNHLPQKVHGIKPIPSPDWAGEKMPVNMDTKERLDRELSVNSYWHSSTLLNIKMANKYFPIIESILRNEGIPEDFKYLAVAESNLRNVTSAASAKGIWQFKKLAAIEYGLEINTEVDERYHIEKATLAACRYLKELKNRFGTWTNAAAAYNIGPTRFSKIIKDQGEKSYYNLNLNSETGRYVFRLISIKEIMQHPSQYGFYLNDEDLYGKLNNTYNVAINKSVDDLSSFAKKYNISYRILKYYNPWLRSNKLTVIKKRYTIKIPNK